MRDQAAVEFVILLSYANQTECDFIVLYFRTVALRLIPITDFSMVVVQRLS